MTWSESYRVFFGKPMRVPAPLRELYRSTAQKLVVMKGAQLGFSEWAINTALWTADTARAGRGVAMYVMPGGETVGDFVQQRVNPVFEASDYLERRIRWTGSTKDPDKVGLRRVGPGYTFWRTARSRAALKSVPADTLVLDEYDEMPVGTLALASHRMDSSTDPWTRILSTPTYPGAGIDPEYLAGDRRRYMLTCPECETEQALEWEANVEDGVRVCLRCRASLEDLIAAAWQDEELGRWAPQNPDAPYPSYQLSQLYRPEADLEEIARALASDNLTTLQEAVNQHLGLPFSPPGGQLSREELLRLCEETPFTFAEIAGVQGCWLGVDIGTRLHCWLSWDDTEGRFGPPRRYLVGAYDAAGFDEVDELWRRFDVRAAVVDAHPELHYAKAFQRRHWGQVWLADYRNGQMPPAMTLEEPPDAAKRYRVSVDRTGAMDALAGALRGGAIRFPRDAEGAPGLFAHLQAPVRRLEPDAQGNPRAVYDEGARADHYYHAGLYAELAAYVGAVAQQRGTFDARQLSQLGSWDRGVY